MTKPIVFLDNLSADKREICQGCSASGETYSGTIPFPLCKIAQLEGRLKKKPTYGETQQIGIDTNSIPEGCPNGYISLTSREIR